MASNAICSIAFALIIFPSISFAFDPRPLQDFCVKDLTGQAPCKDPKTVTADDFYRGGLNIPGNTSNPYGFAATAASVDTVPGFNTMGMTFVRVDLAPHGYSPPHYHSRATELVSVVKGSLLVGFITSYPDYRYFNKVLNEGDVFIVPPGLVHFAQNVAKGGSVAMVTFNSQSPDSVFIPDVVFAAKPAVDARYLAKAFKLDEKTVKGLQMKQWF